MTIQSQLRTVFAAPIPDNEKAGVQYTRFFMLTMWFGCGLGTVAVLFTAWQAETLQPAVRMIGWCLMGMLASMAVGGFLGMLFGIPRIDAPTETAPFDATRTRIRQSDSLEQIADWLTKTIVGVTLVQSEDAVRKLVDLSRAFSVQIYGLNDKYYVPGMATIVAFFTIGFMLAYVWTRRYWILEILVTTKHLDDARLPSLERALQVVGEATQSEQKIDREALNSLAMVGKGWSTTPTPEEADDPWRGKFGGRAIDSTRGRKLRVEFLPDTISASDAPSGRHEWVRLRIIVESTDPARPLNGLARFFLHNTFPNPIREVAVKDGVATVELRAWGGNFTVGAQTDGGECQLEQHIATVAPTWIPLAWREA